MKEKLLALLIVAVMCIFCGCGSDEQKETLVENIDYTIFNYVDESTGVNYLIYDGCYSGGIIPRYNADGTLYVTP